MSVWSFFIKRCKSFKYAFAGIWTMLKTQHNSRVHLAATIMVVLAGLFFNVSRAEWAVLIIAITSVWVAEAFNTSIEFMADVISPEINPLIRNAKDVVAGAVLIAAIGALIIGCLVFMPHLFKVCL